MGVFTNGLTSNGALFLSFRPLLTTFTGCGRSEPPLCKNASLLTIFGAHFSNNTVVTLANGHGSPPTCAVASVMFSGITCTLNIPEDGVAQVWELSVVSNQLSSNSTLSLAFRPILTYISGCLCTATTAHITTSAPFSVSELKQEEIVTPGTVTPELDMWHRGWGDGYKDACEGKEPRAPDVTTAPFIDTTSHPFDNGYAAGYAKGSQDCRKTFPNTSPIAEPQQQAHVHRAFVL